jgi:uncharacterized protein YndB with AHSA1/START domain
MSGEIVVSRVVPAAAEEVFDAWTNPELVGRFLTPEPGYTAAATMDARVGGAYAFSMFNGGEEYQMWGEFREIQRPSRLSFTWKESDDFETLVTITIEPLDPASSRITLAHAGMPDPNYEQGWEYILDCMEGVLAGR